MPWESGRGLKGIPARKKQEKESLNFFSTEKSANCSEIAEPAFFFGGEAFVGHERKRASSRKHFLGAFVMFFFAFLFLHLREKKVFCFSDNSKFHFVSKVVAFPRTDQVLGKQPFLHDRERKIPADMGV